MTEAEHSLREAVADIPAEVRERFVADKELNDKYREIILDIARKALASYQPKPESESRPEPETGTKSRLESQNQIAGDHPNLKDGVWFGRPPRTLGT
jgi:F-type H+-transporting ATPase subunit alpha